MDLWAAVKEFMSEYYSECRTTGVEKDVPVNPLERIIRKASRDCDFRRALLTSPVKALADEGFSLPGGFKVEFVEEERDTICIPLPPYVAEVAREEGEGGRKLHAIIQRAVTEREFRRRLREDPPGVLTAEGFTIPAGKKVRVLECSDDRFYAILPLGPEAEVCDVRPFDFRVEGNVVHIEGHLDTVNAARIRDTLLAREGDLTIDLGGTTYISSAGLALFLALLKRTRKAGWALKIEHVRPEVRNVFVLAGFDKEFGI